MDLIAVTPNQAAEMTSLSRQTIFVAMATGCIKSVSVGKVGHKNIILVSELENFIRNCALLGLRIDDDPKNMEKVAETIKANRT